MTDVDDDVIYCVGDALFVESAIFHLLHEAVWWSQLPGVTNGNVVGVFYFLKTAAQKHPVVERLHF